MRRLPTFFFATAALFALIGMGWGIQMSASHDHTLSPAHGHLNLIGFVAMAVFGTYYALTPRAAAAPVGLVHYALSVGTVAVFIPGIAAAITGRGAALAQIGALMALATMLLFLGVVLRYGAGAQAPERAAGMAATPAE